MVNPVLARQLTLLSIMKIIIKKRSCPQFSGEAKSKQIQNIWFIYFGVMHKFWVFTMDTL